LLALRASVLFLHPITDQVLLPSHSSQSHLGEREESNHKWGRREGPRRKSGWGEGVRLERNLIWFWVGKKD
jgi:hypothetical protein